jgi:hypothetical protein
MRWLEGGLTAFDLSETVGASQKGGLRGVPPA